MTWDLPCVHQKFVWKVGGQTTVFERVLFLFAPFDPQMPNCQKSDELIGLGLHAERNLGRR
jgi:hypothetical protein